jgi:hypothetical protein
LFFFPNYFPFFPTFPLYFFWFFKKIIFIDFTFWILSWLKISLCNFFSFKILWITTVFSHIVFLFYFFIFQNYFCWFYFSILSWLRI